MKIRTESEEDTVIVAPEVPVSPRKKIVPGTSPRRKFENLNVSKSVSLNQGDLTASVNTSENVSPDISQRKGSADVPSFTFDNPRETILERKLTDVNKARPIPTNEDGVATFGHLGNET